MKKIIFATLMMLALRANAFQLSAECQFNPSNGECSVINNTPDVISCRLRIFGQTSMGYRWTGFELATLYPGQYAYAYVYAKNPAIDPLVIVNGDANCRVLR